MKKISRKDLQGLRQQFPVLTKELMQNYVGGLTDRYLDLEWLFSDPDFTDFGINMRSSSGFGGSSYGYTDGNLNLPPMDDYYPVNGGMLDEVTIYGNKPYNPTVPNKPDIPYSYPEIPDKLDPINPNPNPKPKPDTDDDDYPGPSYYYDDWGNNGPSGGGPGWGGYPEWNWSYIGGYYGYGNYGNTSGGGGGNWGGGSGESAGSEAAATSTFLDGLTGYLKQTFSNLVTGTAEVAFNVYEKINGFLQQHPGSISTIRNYMRKVEGYVKIETDPNKMGWGDLFNIWLFELDARNLSTNDGITTLTFSDNAQTTKDLQTQEGVLQARDKAINQIKSGETSSINHTWKYDVNEFIDGVLEMNTATSFLGSYNTKVDIVDNHDGTYKLTYTVLNATGWESGTRLRVNHDTDDNVHDAIIPDCNRGEGVGLGGTIVEKWKWSETIKIK